MDKLRNKSWSTYAREHLMSCKPTQSNLMERRVNHIARHEPNVQAFVDGTFDSDRVLDAIARSDQRLALNGLLLGVKDIINVDKFSTRCGSVLPAHLFSGPQASCATRLFKAGAVLSLIHI